jgi:hypothetical protein
MAETTELEISRGSRPVSHQPLAYRLLASGLSGFLPVTATVVVIAVTTTRAHYC